MIPLPHSLHRTITIRAGRETVFRFLTDSRRWALWWGAGSSIEPHKGGRVAIHYPNGVAASGEVLELLAPELLVITLGYLSGRPMPPGGSRVTFSLEGNDEGTRLHLTHEFADLDARNEHVQGWRYQLALFANVIADEVCAGAAAVVDEWFSAWAEPDEATRLHQLTGIATDAVRFRDRHSLIDGIADLMPHLAAAQRFMPGLRLRRTNELRQCQGTVLADWEAVTGDEQVKASGTNVFVFDAHGKVESVTGFWGASK